MSIRKSLYLVAALMTLLPLLLFAVYENNDFNTKLIAEREKEFVEFAKAHGEIFVQTSHYLYTQIWLSAKPALNIDNLHETLKTTEGVDDISLKLSDAVNNVGSLDSGIKKISDMIIFDKDGEILTSNNTQIIGINIAGTPLFDMLTDEGSAASPFVESQFGGGAFGLWLTRPLSGDLYLSAFVLSDVYSLNHFSFDKTGHYMTVNKEGIIITHPNALFIGMVLDNTDIRDALTNNIPKFGSGSGRIIGAEQVYGYSIINGFDVAVCVIQQRDEILSMKSSFLRDGSFIAVLFGVVAMLIFIPLLHLRIITPITALKERISLASGEQNSEDKPKNEIGTLARGFDHLADQISERVSELEHSNRMLIKLEEELRHDKERLRLSEQRFKSAVDISTIAIFELIPYTNEFFFSDSWCKITTYTEYTSNSVYPLDFVLHNIIHQDYRSKLIDWYDRMTGHYEEELRIYTIDGSLKWLHLNMAAVEDDVTGIKKISGTITDINDRMAAQEFSEYMTHHEVLTGFPHRSLFCQDVSEKLCELKSDCWGVIVILNVANIKHINDIFGFLIGDKVVVVMAELLKKNFGKEMYYSRNSGDSSFLLYIEIPADVEHLDNLSNQILNLFRKPLLINNMSVAADVRMGASIYPLHGNSIEELIQYADIAMIEAWYVKNTDFALFDRMMITKIRRTHQIMQILQEFAEINALYLVYQPILDTDKKCLGFEALVRLNITSMGFISPAEFIPLAEDARLIVPMGKEILRTACNKAMELINSGHDFEYMSVNASPIQLSDGDFVEMVFEVLKETGLPPEKLQLEVTESVMVSDVDVVCEKLRALRETGIRIALDDFGTGYSSMKYLRNIPLDVLKIDKHFIDEIEDDKQQIFAFMMIQMAHQLGLKVVAEGVETKTQFEILKDNGCDCIQGYYFSRPINEDAIEAFLQEH